jgi:flagellar motor switch protein FliN/FliY
MAMANAADNQACAFIATTFGQLLARALKGRGGGEWQVGLVEPPSATLPVLESPILYCLRFGERLEGACYAVLAQADAAVFGGREQPAAKDADMVADAESLVEEPAAAVLDLMRNLAEALPEALAAAHGVVSIAVEPVESLDPLAVFALELQVRDGDGRVAVILLHFDPALLASLAPAAPPESRPVSAPVDKAIQANLGLVMDVELSCTLRFGQRQLSLREILDLASGSVVELDRQVDEPVELILDGRVIARGEAVIIDGNYGLRVTQVLHTVAF